MTYTCPYCKRKVELLLIGDTYYVICDTCEVAAIIGNTIERKEQEGGD